jgi:hypothetical protein
MKVFLPALFLIILFSSCQKESNGDISRLNGNTDTSVIAKVTCIPVGSDTSYTTYKNNTINGEKGYIIEQSIPQLNFSGKSEFIYNNDQHLTDINSVYHLTASVETNSIKVSWLQGRIAHIRWTENGAVMMDRDYQYDESGDTLRIRYHIKYLPATLDSAAFVILTDTGWNKIREVFKIGITEEAGTGNTYEYYKDFTYDYLASDIAAEHSIEEGHWYQNGGTPPSYHYYKDSSVMLFIRQSQTNLFWNGLEDKIMGKQLRILSYDRDSVFYLFDDYFNLVSNNNLLSLLDNCRQSISTAKQTRKVYQDATLVRNDVNAVFIQSTYLYDASGRITNIKRPPVAFDLSDVETRIWYP